MPTVRFELEILETGEEAALVLANYLDHDRIDYAVIMVDYLFCEVEWNRDTNAWVVLSSETRV